jgi:hypothetical protein
MTSREVMCEVCTLRPATTLVDRTFHPDGPDTVVDHDVEMCTECLTDCQKNIAAGDRMISLANERPLL